MHNDDSTSARRCLRRPLPARPLPRRRAVRTVGLAEPDAARLDYLLAAERLEDASAEAQSALYRLAAAENKPLAQLQAELGLSA